MRIRVPSAKGRPESLEQIRKALTGVTGVHTVEVNESIGSITINYNADRHPDIENHLSSQGAHRDLVAMPAPARAKSPNFEEMHDLDTLLEKEAEFLAGHSKTARMLFDLVDQLDEKIKQTTDNAVDLKVIAPLALAAGIFFELGIAASTPVWLTLSLFSFNHFIDLHSHPETRMPVSEPAGEPKPGKPKARRFP